VICGARLGLVPGALLLLALLAPTAPAADAPLNIAADNMTGSRGPEGDEVLLNGNVRITRGRTVLTSETGRYLRGQGMLYLDGHVRMVDSTATITSDHASYAEGTDVLQLDGNVVVTDHDAVLRAPSATYDRRLGRADLSGPVDALDKDQHLLADRAFYFRDSLLVQARGNVRGMDVAHKLSLNARAIDFDRGTRVAIATGDPVLKATGDDGRTTELRAIKLNVNTQTRVAEAIDSVRVMRDTLQARADHARFDDVAQHGWLTGHPRVWDDQTTMSGDSLELWTHDRALTRARVTGNASMRYIGARPNSLGEASLLEGKNADIYFTREDIDSLVAIGDAKNEYQGAPRTGKTSERNLATGDTITVFFKDRKVDRARVEGSAKGVYRPSVNVGDTLAAKREVVDYDARRIEFRVPQSLIVLDKDSHLTYGDLELRARRVEFDIDRQTLVAQGQPVLNDRGDKVTGNLMTYDLESRVGTIYRAETAYEKGLYHGERIRKVGENELDVLNGAYSTCDLTTPHYHFSARYMKIYLKDKLVAKPVVFYLRNVPLFALPFWVFPIKPGRHSGFLFPQFEFGFSNSAGQFLRNAGYYWAPNDYMDLTASGDYYQAEPSWVMRGEGNYKLLYRLDGSFRGTYAKNENPQRPAVDWDFNADHSQDLTPRTHLIARAQFVSSKDYSASDLFGRTLAERLNRFLTSSLSFAHNADWASINAVLDRRQDLDADQSIADPDGFGPLLGPAPGTESSLASLTESTPSMSISFPTRAIGSLGLLKGTPLATPLKTMYFSLNTQFLSQTERRGVVTGYQMQTVDSTTDSTTTLGERRSTRRGLTANTALSDSRRLFGWLNFQPRISANMAVFDFDELGHKVVPTGTWSSSFTTGSTFYRTFQPRRFGIEGIRHIVSPNVQFVYSPEFRNLTFIDSTGVRRERFTSFGGIGVSGFQSERMDFSLDQRLQVKRKRGDQVQRLDNLLSWTLSGSYNFLYRQQRQVHGLSAIGSSVFLQPPGFVNANLTWVTDVYSARPVRSLGYNVGMNLTSGGGKRNAPADLPVDQTVRGEQSFNENWTAGLAYSYSGGYEGEPFWTSTQTANGVGRYQFSPAWGLEYSTSYDITRHLLQTQRFGLTRDLHCWMASFTRTFNSGGQAEYYFRLAIKDQKEIYVERGTRVGSIGGIQ
jgi:lipopolysaccharide assembly outer membrane protein LptD (OstA)